MSKQLPAPVDDKVLTLAPVMDARLAKERLLEIQGFIKDVFVEGEDYGNIPGTGSKKTLLKAGAEKLTEIYGFCPSVEILQQIEDWDKEPPLFDYTIKTVLRSRRDNTVLFEGLGSCNSYETKYKYRNAGRVCPACDQETIKVSKFEPVGSFYCFQKAGGCGAKFDKNDPAIINQVTGKVPNPDIADCKNTVLKMAKKRSLVDAVIGATRSSAIFTQDMEDFKSYAGPTEDVVDAEEVSEPAPKSVNTVSNRTAPSGSTNLHSQKRAETTSSANSPSSETSRSGATAASNLSLNPNFMPGESSGNSVKGATDPKPQTNGSATGGQKTSQTEPTQKTPDHSSTQASADVPPAHTLDEIEEIAKGFRNRVQQLGVRLGESPLVGKEGEGIFGDFCIALFGETTGRERFREALIAQGVTKENKAQTLTRGVLSLIMKDVLTQAKKGAV